MDIQKRNFNHYLYLLLLLVTAVWLTQIILNYNSWISAAGVAFFILLNIIFGIKEVTILENGIEKKYRFNFILGVICLLVFGPAAACISTVAASAVYIPLNQYRHFKKVDIPSLFLHIFSLNIAVNVMSITFFYLGGKVYSPAFESTFPENVIATLAGTAANFAINTLIISFWIKLYNFKTSVFKLIKKEFLWLIRYDLWQAIYAILIVNTIILYSWDLFFQFTHSKTNIGIRDFVILSGIVIVAFIFYYPIKERRREFQLLIEFNRQNVDLKVLSQKLKENNKKVVRAFISMLEKRDPYTCGHSERVALYSGIIAKKMGMDAKRLEMLEMAGLLHDIGKIGVDINIINKTSRLTDEEYNEIQKHPIYGVEILERMYKGGRESEDDEFQLICDIANSHHERYDGKGYPKGMKGEDISLEARIISVADSLDAMTSDRSYRLGMSFEKAIDEIKKNAGTQFCPKVIETFLKCVEEGNLKIYKDEDVSQWLNVFS